MTDEQQKQLDRFVIAGYTDAEAQALLSHGASISLTPQEAEQHLVRRFAATRARDEQQPAES